MSKERQTALIENVKVGRVDHYEDIVITLTFNMNGSGCMLTFSFEQIKKMMIDSKVYDDIQGLVGKPCEILGGWGQACEFLGMWKK